MKPFLLLMLALPLGFLGQAPPVNSGVIEGKVTRPSSPEGIPEVQITLVGPSPVSAASLSGVYTPNASLTPAMRDQINALISSAPPGIAPEAIASAAMRMESQLLGLPLPQQQLANNQAATQPPQTVVATDRDGVFAFRNLAPGRYQIRAQRDGYFGTPPPGAVGTGVPTIVNTTATVVAGQPTPPVTITMLRGGIVSGRVRDPNGQPMSTSQVGAYQITYQNGRKVLQQINSKQSDDRGEYRLFWLPPGDYLIGTVPRRLGTQAPTAQDSYARTFFPNIVDARQAQVVKIVEGAEISGIDIGVRADAIGKISGKVVTSLVGPNGQPAIASIFYLLSADTNGLADTGLTNFQNTSPNRQSGQFELRGILPGQYELMSNVNDGNGRQVWGRTRVNVNGELNDVALSIQPGVEVKVRTTVDGALPAYTMQTAPQGLRGATVSVINGVVTTGTQPTPPSPVPTPTYRVQLRSAEGIGITAPFENATNQDPVFDPATGTTVFRSVVPGRYSINVQPLPPNGYVAEVRAAGSATDAGIDISGQTDEIQVLLKTDGKRIEGVVRDALQQPAVAARVVLVPTSPSRRQNPLHYKIANTSATGTFTINGIAPGEYKLFAWENVPNTAWMNAEFLEPYEARGQAVSLGSNPTVNVELKLIPKG
jgi:hypothetical protein